MFSPFILSNSCFFSCIIGCIYRRAGKCRECRGRSDSFYDENGNYVLGPNDLDLAMRLANSSTIAVFPTPVGPIRIICFLDNAFA